MAGFDNDVMYARNVDFTNGFPVTRQVTAAGQLLIGTGNLFPLPEITVGTLTAGPGVSIVNGPGTITISLAGGGVGIDSIGVQASTAPGTNPVVPDGAGLLTINGASVAAGGIPVRSNSIAVNTLQIEVQRSINAGGSSAANAGLASFSNAAFGVDANGFVTLLGGGQAATNFTVDAFTGPGTNPVVPNISGNISVTGTQVASGTNPIRTNSLAANAYQIQVQRSQALGVSTLSANGLSHFNSAHFSVDANGFVSNLNGVSASAFDVDAFTGPGTDPVLPNASGIVAVSGAQVAAGTNPIRTNSIAANSYQIQVQRSQAIGVSTATANGICHFDSASFAVDGNGFVTFTGGSAFTWVESSGGALAVSTGYFANTAAVYTLPAGTSDGETIEIVDFIGGGVVVTAQGGDEIRVGNTVSSANGTATSTQTGDALRLVFRLASQTWVSVPSAAGVWILA